MNYLKIAEEDFLTLIYEKMNTDKPTTAEEVMEVMAFHQAIEQRTQELQEELKNPKLTPEEKRVLEMKLKVVNKMDYETYKNRKQQKKE